MYVFNYNKKSYKTPVLVFSLFIKVLLIKSALFKSLTTFYNAKWIYFYLFLSILKVINYNPDTQLIKFIRNMKNFIAFSIN